MTSTADASMREEHVGKARQTPPHINLLRRLPSCDSQPPFDDELPLTVTDVLHPPAPHVRDRGQRALSLAFALPGGLPAVPSLPNSLRAESDRSTPELRLVPALIEPARRRPVRDVTDEDDAPRPTPRELLPEPVPWAGRLVQGILEVLSGVRPLSQLVRWTTTEVYDSISTRTEHRFRRMSEKREVAPHRLAEVVRSVHVSEPVDGIAEVCAIVQQGPRCRAIALRLEGIDGRWQCTALQIG
jgi:uncharacterized protein DUF6459